MKQYNKKNANQQLHQSQASQLISLLKGRIWTLNLVQAQKYYEFSQFVKTQNDDQIEELYKIKLLLQRRIDNLHEMEILEKQKTNQLLRLQLIQKEIEKAELQYNQTLKLDFHQTNRHNQLNIKEFQLLLQNINNQTIQLQCNQYILNQQITIQSSSQIYHQTNQNQNRSYDSIYNNIKNLSSTDESGNYSQQSQIDIKNVLDNDKKRTSLKKKKSIRSNLLHNFFRKMNGILKHIPGKN